MTLPYRRRIITGKLLVLSNFLKVSAKNQITGIELWTGDATKALYCRFIVSYYKLRPTSIIDFSSLGRPKRRVLNSRRVLEIVF
jgi:hypothetical protein